MKTKCWGRKLTYLRWNEDIYLIRDYYTTVTHIISPELGSVIAIFCWLRTEHLETKSWSPFSMIIIIFFYHLPIITRPLKSNVIFCFSADADSLAYTLGPKTRISDEITFVICQSCFWCASCLSSRILSTIAETDGSSSLTKCSSCIEGNIESIPIAENENYRFDYDTRRGLTMEFFRWDIPLII